MFAPSSYGVRFRAPNMYAGLANPTVTDMLDPQVVCKQWDLLISNIGTLALRPLRRIARVAALFFSLPLVPSL